MTRGRNMAVLGERTRGEILEVAERLFAQQGPTAVSIRAIAKAANVSLSAVNYHFGSKEQLFQAVVERRVIPLNEERMRLLDACGEAEIPRLECLIEAMVKPAMRLSDAGTSARGILVMQFLERAFAPPGARDTFEALYAPVRTRFIGLVKRALPHLGDADILWRYNFLGAAILYSVVIPSGRHAGPLGAARSADPPDAAASERTLQQVVAYALGGFLAPPVQPWTA